MATQPDVRRVYEAVRSEVVGRERELTSILAALSAGRDLLLEGPPGTSKSTILRAITSHYEIPLVFVEGNADLTPAKLIGYHDPAQVVRNGYRPEDFVPGPLPRAMREGGFLYIEEFNRVPEDTLNGLLTAMAEREITVPRVGKMEAETSFRIVAAMNPFDNIGTARISVSIYDRLCRLSVGYQTESEERDIVALHTGGEIDCLVEDAVEITRRTREHEEARLGSSVRGAIDLVLVARRLAEMRGASLNGSREVVDSVLLEAASLALSSKVSLHETFEKTPEDMIREIVGEVAPKAVDV